MDESTAPSRSAPGRLSAAQRRAVLRGAVVAVALVLTLPVYYGLRPVVPGLAAVVPPVVIQATMAVGLCVALPATLAYAYTVAPAGEREAEADSPQYGVDDRWERENL